MTDRRIGLVGFHSRTGEIFREQGLNVVSHIFANPEDKGATFPDSDNRINFHDWKQYRLQTNPAPPGAQPFKHMLRDKCFGDFIRCTDRWDWSRELVNDWSGYEHLFSLAFDDAWAWLIGNEIQAVVYSNVPHQGIAVVQFHLAQLMGIKTRIFLQSPFAGRSWLLDHWNDLGRFECSLPGEPFKIDVSEPDAPPFYMKSVRGDFNRKIRVMAHRMRARTIVGFGLTGLTPESRRRSYQRNMNRWQHAVEDEFYLNNYADTFSGTPSDEPYLYFPLHLQPEMTTDILGGVYADQVSALEELRSLVPPEVAIYVKENPKQLGRMRGTPFFERIRRITNITLLDRTVPSLDLIRNAMAVATISGTVGWEALRMGKPAIVFGNAFWSQLPGAFNYESDLIWTWEDVEKFEFDPGKLEKAVSKLSTHAHPGICDPVYSVLAKDFEVDENARTLCRTLVEKGQL